MAKLDSEANENDVAFGRSDHVQTTTLNHAAQTTKGGQRLHVIAEPSDLEAPPIE